MDNLFFIFYFGTVRSCIYIEQLIIEGFMHILNFIEIWGCMVDNYDTK